jgi:EmrB/QacA subfamily drug resistance transporter
MDPGRRRGILIAVVLASGIVFLDTTVVNVALRAIGEDLPTSFVGVLEGQSYVVNGYLLTLSALLILSGALADYYGRRRIFRIGLFGFAVTSVLCGLSPTMEVLIGARLLQGAFGALLVPSSLAIITASFEGPERGRAFGVWAAASAATTILGPPVGGFLVDTIGWPVAFLMNVPLLGVALFFATTAVPESRNEQASRRFDWLGAGAVALAVGGLAYGAIRGEQTEWTDASAWVALVIGAVGTLALYPLMRYRRDPLVPLDLFRSRNFSTTNLSTFLIYGALYVFAYYQAIFLQGTLGYSATGAGLAGLPISIMLALFSTSVGGLAGRYGVRWFMTGGPIVMALGLLWLTRIPPDSDAWLANPGQAATLLPPVDYLVDVFPGILLFAVGITILVAPLTTALMTSVPVANSGLASALNNALSRIGPLLVGAVIFVAVSSAFYAGLAQRVPGLDTSAHSVREQLPPLNPPGDEVTPDQTRAAREASTDAFHLAMLISAGLCAAGAAVNAIGIRDPRREEAASAREAAPVAGE